MHAHWLIVVPARLASTRLPRKPLASLGGKPLIVRVVKNLDPLKLLGAKIVVACDSDEVYRTCIQHNIETELTDVEHISGTDRVAEVARRHGTFQFILNVQGDEPFVNTSVLASFMNSFEKSHLPLGTIFYRSNSLPDFLNPNIVKVIRNHEGQALYFTRAPVPFPRDHWPLQPGDGVEFCQHLGIYAFRAKALQEFCKLPVSPLELTEKLEQLRALESGWSIHLAESTEPGFGIDTPEDLAKAEIKISTLEKGLN